MRRAPSPSSACCDSSSAPSGLVCRVCAHPAPEDESVALWLEGELVFSICHGCMDAHDIVLRPGPSGVEVHAKYGARLQGPVPPARTLATRKAQSRRREGDRRVA